MGKKVLLGMSGGVDSSVAAIILKQQGYEVIGATMKLLCDCNTTNSIQDAKKVCEQLQIEHHVLKYEQEFKTHVIDDFINCYKNAITPNPCIECNKYLKFGVFYQKALELNCDYIATGHYAKIEYLEKYNQYVLRRSEEQEKDQSYFLYGISKNILPKIIFPLQNIKSKEEIRKIAEQNNLFVARKKDSQEICFIPDNDYIKFLQENSTELPSKGKIVLNNKQCVGEHNGLINYTIGQRKGLGVSYKQPLYVVKLDKDKNEVVVGTEQDLYCKQLLANDLNFVLDIDLSKPIEIYAKVRYRAKPAKAILEILENGVAKVIFEQEQRAITKGQSVVFYLDDILLGGGKIL